VLEHPQVVERGLVRRFAAPPGVDRDIEVVRAGFRLAGGDPVPDRPPPPLGVDNAAILAELGYDEAGMERLRREKAI
jgi:crotonobetainyl-CoA:carnitine CoA-transferase CaiB-like acyl-CoA transferase